MPLFGGKGVARRRSQCGRPPARRRRGQEKLYGTPIDLLTLPGDASISTVPEAFVATGCRLIKSGGIAVGKKYNRVAFKTLSNFLFVFVGLCLLGGFPAHSAPPAADTACLIGTIDLNPVSGEVRDLKTDTDCKNSYSEACDLGAVQLNKNCRDECSGQKQYSRTSNEYTRTSKDCVAKLPVATHRPQYIEARDCQLRADDNSKWAVSCTVTAQSCMCGVGN
jgi:hypothetical protein